MLVPQQVHDDVAVAAEDEDIANEIPTEPTPPSPATTPPPQSELIPLLSQEDASKQEGKFAKLDADEDVTLEEVDDEKDAEEPDEAEPAEVEEVLEVVTAAKLITEVVTTATTTITVDPVPKVSAPRRRRDVIIQEPKDAAAASLKQVKRKERQDNTVMRYQDLKRKPVTKAQARKYMMAFLEKGEKEIEEEESKESKRKSKSFEQKAAKKQTIDEEVEELKTHLQIVPNDEDDVCTEATPLALKVPVIDYQIHHEQNKPFYKIIRADGSHQLFLIFITLLRNFDREDLEMLWKIVQERFKSSEPKNF
nr:hypothetical protein [Tanacetum cinerariifolium]